MKVSRIGYNVDEKIRSSSSNFLSIIRYSLPKETLTKNEKTPMTVDKKIHV